MESKADTKSATTLYKRFSEVLEDDSKQSKHSSVASEVDCAIIETCIAEAVVQSVSSESFAVLETGNTVRLTFNAPELPKDKGSNDQAKPLEQGNNKPLTIQTAETEIKMSANQNSATATTTVSTTVNGYKAEINKTMQDNSPSKGKVLKDDVKRKKNKLSEGNKKYDENDHKQKSQRTPNDNVINDKKSAEKIFTDTKLETRSDPLQSNQVLNAEGLGSDPFKVHQPQKSVENTILKTVPASEVQTETTVSIPNKQSLEKTQTENQLLDNLQNKTPKLAEKDNQKETTPTRKDSEQEVTLKTESQQVTTLITESQQEVKTLTAESEETVPPEITATMAQKLTMMLAKQMVDATTNVASQMIGTTTNALTMYNGTTLELADIDYFVIYKNDKLIPGDGITFISRMELGTNSISKVIPVGTHRAWVAYHGGGVKLIDTGSESVIKKLDIPGLDTIAASDDTYLFISNINSFSLIEKWKLKDDGSTESSPVLKLSKCRIACFTVSKSSRNVLLCVEKRNSCLCIQRKSEVVVQIYDTNGKRIKELKPKVNGQLSKTTGFPIVMCQNIHDEICIASFNNIDHTCAVEVYDKHMERLFVYDGDKTLSPRFMCEDMCTDKQGNILMLDNSLKSVHIVNLNGSRVKLISIPKFRIENPKCINVDVNGRLWIGQGPPAQMIVLEYFV